MERQLSPHDPTCLKEQLRTQRLHLEDDGRVSWDEKNNDHPRNWHLHTKYYTAATIFWLEFFMTGISTAGAAAAESARTDYGIGRTLAYFAFITIYLLGQTVGGIFLSPISETFGRRTLYIVAALVFSAASAIVAAIPSIIAVYFGRFFQGVAAAIPATVAFGNFEDMFDAHVRIWVVYSYTLSGMIGLAMGPIYSSYITEALGWRWVFYISTIVSGLSAAACFGTKESKATRLLQVKVNCLRRETDCQSLFADVNDRPPTIKSFVRESLLRPLEFLFTEPLVFFCAILCAIAFGVIYGLTESLTIVYTSTPFGFSQTSSSLAFIAILIGEILDVIPRIYDDHVFKRYRKSQRCILPESKITSFAIACPSLALGLWIFAWTIPPRVTNTPWPISMLGLICVGFSLNDFSYVLFGYITDSYGKYAASGVAAISLTRTLAAAIFPLFTYQMYTGLGSNVATSILAGVATLFALTPFLFLRYGEKLRHISRTASNNEVCLVEENSHLAQSRDGGFTSDPSITI